MLWITGSFGMLGQEVKKQFDENHINYLATTSSEVDISDFPSVLRFVQDKNINWIINCAAYTAVDKAESDKEKCFKVNATGAENLAKAAKSFGAKLIHISTDYVFDGTNSRPYLESDPVCPIGVYGYCKAEGEKNIQIETQNYFILRTSWLYGFYGKNFVYTMLKLMNSRESIKVVCDQRGTPTNCVTLASVILKIIQTDSSAYGIYNVTDEGETTWFEFAKEIQKKYSQLNKKIENCFVNPCLSSEYISAAKRPAYSVLSKEKIKTTFNITLPDWKESLYSFLMSENFNSEMIK
ncbi:MAG: dTDP-4-dehydrorhamnose reductase [Spirochaetia bacterium]|nr:dTDP-4-dehydrorhamnose reductase [Spirochaetia bacterium]